MPTLSLCVDVSRFNLEVSVNASSQVVFEFAPLIGAVKVLSGVRVCPSTMWCCYAITNHSINVKYTPIKKNNYCRAELLLLITVFYVIHIICFFLKKTEIN
jgi:hypothetical protein